MQVIITDFRRLERTVGNHINLRRPNFGNAFELAPEAEPVSFYSLGAGSTVLATKETHGRDYTYSSHARRLIFGE